MTSKAQVLIPIIAAAAIIGVVGILSIPSDSKLETVEFPRGTIKLDDTLLEVQIADTQPRRVRGLMFQDQLPYTEGMLFVFDAPSSYSMWMLNMQFPLDLIWFDKNGNVIHIEKDVKPCKSALETATCSVVNPANNDAMYILEVTAGFVEKFQITENSVLELISV